jgi:hypothetical protein
MEARSFTHGMLRLVPSRGGISLAFSKFLDTAIALNSGIESIVPTLMRSYDKPERYLFMETYYALLDESICRGHGMNDVLGDFYGQYVDRKFIATPQQFCDLMPSLRTADMASQRVADMRCRSGRHLMAAARHNRWLRLYGADPDITMVRMALLNFFMNELSGEVAWYDARIDEFHGVWSVDLDYRGKPVIRELEQEKSLIFQKRGCHSPRTARLVLGY